MKYKKIRGFHDILPDKIKRWHFVEDCARKIFESYGYSEIRLPVLESTGIYRTGIGNTSDIVEKEMYTFEDRDGSSLSLRPEGTAGVVRSFIENSLGKKSPTTKLYYIGPMFRHERPQKGRFRGFNQIGCEYFGSAHPNADTEIIMMLHSYLNEIGFGNSLKLELNSLGDEETRSLYREALLQYLMPNKDKLCESCRGKLEKNPLRILDCKNEGCKKITGGAPEIIDYLSVNSKKHFDTLISILKKISLPYEINSRIVRGLDYYTETVFEFTTDLLGSQNAVAAGGRYDNLVEKMGGPSTPAIGFALGTDRLVLLHEELNTEDFGPATDVFVAWLGERSFIEGFKIADSLRKNGKSVFIEHDEKSLKSQLKRADRLGARHAVIIGEEELKNNQVLMRDMKHSEEQAIDNDPGKIEDYISKQLQKKL